MADESYSFSTARTRLEEIVTQVRKKDTSLEKSLDLLEEGVRLANACTELIDHAEWVSAGADATGLETADPEAPAQEADTKAPATDHVEASTSEEPETAVASATASEYAEDDDGYDDAWSDAEVPADELAADDDPSSDER